MKKSQFNGKLISYERKSNSVNGNPKYFGVFEAENGDILRATTGTDCSCGYSFLNKIEALKEVTYHVTKNGNTIITYIKEA